MLIINNNTQIQEQGNIFERSYDIRGQKRKSIEIRIPPQEGVDYNTLLQIFSDGAQIVKREIIRHVEQKLIKEATETEDAEYEEIEVEDTLDKPLTDYIVAGDIVDKRDGSFVVYMGEKTEAEQLNEELAMVLLGDINDFDGGEA